jgi:hypothetical protein
MIKESPRAQFLFSVESSLKNETGVMSIVFLLCINVVKNETEALSTVSLLCSKLVKKLNNNLGFEPGALSIVLFLCQAH